MAGDWLKIEVALPDKPEVWQIAGILGIDPDAVVGKLLKVWRWFDSHTEDGNANGVTFLLVDAKAGVTGFAEAMSLCGWLEQKGSILSLPNFDRHNGKTAKNRALTAVRVANSRKPAVKSNAECNDASVTSALAREEKRREEKKEDKELKSPATATDPCPHQKIIELYHGALPELMAVREWTDDRQAKLRSRWKEKPERQSLEWWADFFKYVAASDFLTGRTEPPFACSLEWLVSPKNFVKVIEGKYENRSAR